VTFAAALGLALLHVGVEQGWWPSPLPGCRDGTLAGARSVEELMARLRPAPGKPCYEPAYLLPSVPVSMAAINLAYAALLLVASVWTLRRPRPECAAASAACYGRSRRRASWAESASIIWRLIAISGASG